MADNPVFVHNEDIPLINDEDYDYEESRYDTPDTSRIEETSFYSNTNQWSG